MRGRSKKLRFHSLKQTCSPGVVASVQYDVLSPPAAKKSTSQPRWVLLGVHQDASGRCRKKDFPDKQAQRNTAGRRKASKRRRFQLMGALEEASWWAGYLPLDFADYPRDKASEKENKVKRSNCHWAPRTHFGTCLDVLVLYPHLLIELSVHEATACC